MTQPNAKPDGVDDLHSFVVPPGHHLVLWTHRHISTEQAERLRAWFADRGIDAALICGIDGAAAVPKNDG